MAGPHSFLNLRVCGSSHSSRFQARAGDGPLTVPEHRALQARSEGPCAAPTGHRLGRRPGRFFYCVRNGISATCISPDQPTLRHLKPNPPHLIDTGQVGSHKPVLSRAQSHFGDLKMAEKSACGREQASLWSLNVPSFGDLENRHGVSRRGFTSHTHRARRRPLTGNIGQGPLTCLVPLRRAAVAHPSPPDRARQGPWA